LVTKSQSPKGHGIDHLGKGDPTQKWLILEEKSDKLKGWQEVVPKRLESDLTSERKQKRNW